MGRWIFLLLTAALLGACPLARYDVEDHPAPEVVAELPVKCTGPIARTSGGAWVCAFLALDGGTRVGVSRAADEVTELPGTSVAVAGSVVWTWGDVLRRFEDPGSGAPLQIPDAGYDWRTGHIVPQEMSAVLPHEREILISANGVQLVTANGERLELTNTAAVSFSNDSHFRNTAWAFVETNDGIWAWGPDSSNRKACRLHLANGGFTVDSPCSETPQFLRGLGYGGLWLSEGPRSGVPIRRYRPVGDAFVALEGADLSAELDWTVTELGLPLATWPDRAHVVVPRMDGDHLFIDRYRGGASAEWAGASEEWVWEWASGTTRVYRR